MLDVLVIAVGLAMDAMAVSVASGSAYKKLHIRHALRVALFFGGFQAFMPIIGYLAGIGLKRYIQGVDHWAAFVILTAIGLKMAYEAFQIEKASKGPDISSLLVLVVLSVATSIDALAVGISLPLILKTPVLEAAVLIGVVTFVLCLFGMYAGSGIGSLLESRMELVGGIILIAIGTKILAEHTLGR